MIRSIRPFVAAAAVLLLAGCAAPTVPAAPDPGSALGDGHGLVAGATEVQDPPTSLVTVSPAGDVELLDLVSGEATAIGTVDAPELVESDGRFLYGIRDGAVDVVDTGVWTQPHGDHVHYYRADPRVVGTLEGEGLAHVAWAGDRATVVFDDGEVVVLDRAALGTGALEPVARLATDADVAAPVEGGVLLGVAADGEVRLVDDTGADRGDPIACPDPRPATPSRPGTVIGCADGAVLGAGSGAEPTLARIPLPDGIAGATGLRSRADRAALAGVSADGTGVVLLAVRDARWTWMPTPETAVAAIAVDDADDHVLVLLADGSVAVLDGGGVVIGRSAPLVAASLAAGEAGIRLDVDAERAYLAGPAEATVWELDYRDSARVARTFALPAGGFAAEVGR